MSSLSTTAPMIFPLSFLTGTIELRMVFFVPSRHSSSRVSFREGTPVLSAWITAQRCRSVAGSTVSNQLTALSRFCSPICLMFDKIRFAIGFARSGLPNRSVNQTPTGSESSTVRSRCSLWASASCACFRSLISTVAPKSWVTCPSGSRTAWPRTSVQMTVPSFLSIRSS